MSKTQMAVKMRVAPVMTRKRKGNRKMKQLTKKKVVILTFEDLMRIYGKVSHDH